MDQIGGIECRLFSTVGRSWIKRNYLKVHDPVTSLMDCFHKDMTDRKKHLIKKILSNQNFDETESILFIQIRIK